MKKNIYIIGWISLVFFLGISVSIKLIPDQKYSLKENRPLTQRPDLTLPTLLDNSYQKNEENYLKDQFPKRDTWMELKTLFEKKIGVKKINDVYFGKNNRLIQEATIPTEDFKERRIQNLKQLIEGYPEINFDFLLVPTKIGIYQNETTSTKNQKKLYQEFTKNFDSSLFKVNTFEILNNYKDEQIYYDTDHHWTTLGAKYVSEAFTNSKNNDYDIYTANKHFIGSLANRIAYYQKEDKIELYVPKEEIKYYVSFPDTKEEKTTLYNKTKQYDTNAYEIFLGGNTSQIEIKTTSPKEKKLLLIKDSYANCFVPFILNEYRDITIIDPRYYFKELDQLIEDKKYTDVLFLYNMNTFFKDTSLDDLIENTFNKE